MVPEEVSQTGLRKMNTIDGGWAVGSQHQRQHRVRTCTPAAGTSDACTPAATRTGVEREREELPLFRSGAKRGRARLCKHTLITADRIMTVLAAVVVALDVGQVSTAFDASLSVDFRGSHFAGKWNRSIKRSPMSGALQFSTIIPQDGRFSEIQKVGGPT